MKRMKSDHWDRNNGTVSEEHTCIKEENANKKAHALLTANYYIYSMFKRR